MTDCAQCGDCCQILNIHGEIPAARTSWSLHGESPGVLLQRDHWTVDDIAAGYQHDFLRAHWHELPRAVVVAIHPRMAAREGPFYWCDQFDAETNTCRAHDLKPQVCAEYPWYGHAPGSDAAGDPGRLDSLRCSYWADVPREHWPPGVRPLPPTNCC